MRDVKIEGLSDTFRVRTLSPGDMDLMYGVCCKNKIFYQYHPPFVTKESILADMTDLPPGKGYEDKFFVGYFDGDTLVAIMDLIRGYPDPETAYIGLFVMNMDYQGKGVGSAIVTECKNYLRRVGFSRIRLAVDKGNPQSNHFWRKNGFAPVKVTTHIVMDLLL